MAPVFIIIFRNSYFFADFVNKVKLLRPRHFDIAHQTSGMNPLISSARSSLFQVAIFLNGSRDTCRSFNFPRVYLHPLGRRPATVAVERQRNVRHSEKPDEKEIGAQESDARSTAAHRSGFSEEN